jgi:survival of motor neuron-related-splicing factor 30
MDSAEDLDAKVAEYREQLRQVSGFLLSDPQNAQFLKLKEDLLKVIDLTNMINSQQNEPASSSSFDQSSKIYEDGDENDLEDNDSTDGNEKSGHIAEGQEPIAVGECVEVLGGDRPYAGVVTAIIDESTCQVKYFEFETEVSLPLSSIFRIAPASEYDIDPEEIKIGQKGIYTCKYATDQTFYDAIVQSLTPNGCVVKYTLYGNVEEVPLAYLKTLVAAVKKNKNDGAQGLIALPDNLRFLPTDTEEDKARKRKKIKAIKSKNRLFTKEAEITAVQQTWQKFVTKGTKKNSLLLPKKTSMFASSDAVDAKIGDVTYRFELPSSIY